MVRVALLALEAGTKKELMTPGPHRFWQGSLRRPSFWLGLFVACFLAWAWRDSFERQHVVRGHSQNNLLLACFHVEGRLLFIFWPDYDWDHRWTVETREVSEMSNAAGLLEQIEEEGGSVARYRVIPDSLVFSSFFGIWVGWLSFSEWRRRTRVARETGRLTVP